MIYSKEIEEKSSADVIGMIEGAMRPPYMVNAYYKEFLSHEHGIDIEPFRAYISSKVYRCKMIPTDNHLDVYVLKGDYKSYGKALEAGLKEGLRIIKERG